MIKKTLSMAVVALCLLLQAPTNAVSLTNAEDCGESDGCCGGNNVEINIKFTVGGEADNEDVDSNEMIEESANTNDSGAMSGSTMMSTEMSGSS